jgi:hypothetical protein
MGLVMIANINTLITAHDSDWIPSESSDYEKVFSNALSSDSESDFIPENNSEDEGVSKVLSRKRKINVPKIFSQEAECMMQNNDSALRVKKFKEWKQGKRKNSKTGKIETKKVPILTCGGCDHPKGNFDTIVNHMHAVKSTKKVCLPQEGMPCLDCNSFNDNAPRFIKLMDMFAHNKKNHGKLDCWNCWLCGTLVKKDKFEDHVKYYTNAQSAPIILEGYSNGSLRVYKNRLTLKQARRMYLASSREASPIPANFSLRDSNSNNALYDAALDAMNELKKPISFEIASSVLAALSQQNKN